jgi:GNAT superfamily N-acetyltransferase
MNDQIKVRSKYQFFPVTMERWKGFEKLFGKNGACAGCWCMFWRITRKDYDAQKGEGNKKAMKKIINSGTVPGIIAYFDNEPIGWCSVAPRTDFPGLENSRILQPVDEKPVWSVSCFYIRNDFRNKGVSVELLKAASKFVKSRKGKILEGYPNESKKDKMPPAFAWHGLASAFRQAGFKEVERRSETRPIMRLVLK